MAGIWDIWGSGGSFWKGLGEFTNEGGQAVLNTGRLWKNMYGGLNATLKEAGKQGKLYTLGAAMGVGGLSGFQGNRQDRTKRVLAGTAHGAALGFQMMRGRKVNTWLAGAGIGGVGNMVIGGDFTTGALLGAGAVGASNISKFWKSPINVGNTIVKQSDQTAKEWARIKGYQLRQRIYGAAAPGTKLFASVPGVRSRR